MKKEQATPINVILARIKKLMRHSKSARELGSLEEAEAFAAKVVELSQQYNIELSTIKVDEEDKDEFSKYMYGEYVNYSCNQAGNRWRLDLVGVITESNFCSYLFNSHHRRFRVYGRMENVDVSIWMYNFLSTGLMRLAQEAHTQRSAEDKIVYGSNRYSFLKDWLLGAVEGIRYKLEQEKKRKENVDQINGLVLYNKEQLSRFLKETNPNVKAKVFKTIHVGSAYAKGYEAGKNYNISKPLQGGIAKATKKIG